MQSKVVNKSINDVPISNEAIKSLVASSLESEWVILYAESVDIKENILLQILKPGLSIETKSNQKKNAVFAWMANYWNIACDQLANIAQSQLVIMESMLIKTRRMLTLKIVEKVPRSRLVQIKDA